MVGNKRVIIVSAHPLPDGDAQSNRIISYARGLYENEADVRIFLSIPRFLDSNNTTNRGEISGINYFYFSTIRQLTVSNLCKVLKYIYIFFSLIIRIIKDRLNNGPLIIILQENKIVFRFFYAFLLRLIGNKVYRDVSEYPNHVLFSNHSLWFKIKSWINFYIELYLLNGLFFMTKNIKDYYLKYKDDINYLIMPMTVEPDRFDCDKLESSNNYGKYIAYCGSMYTNKDGIPILIGAFNKIAERFSKYSLLLIGDNSNKSKFNYINKLIRESEYPGRIIVTGRVSRKDMPIYLCNADILALARPYNKQAEGGFPTKLGEYLATGNPVVVTAVGEIPHYLIDRKHAFICNDISIDGFARELEFAISNKSEAKSIGLKGKELAYTVFNYKYQGKKLFDFIF